MVDPCVDGNDQVTQNTLLINKIPAIDGAGRYTLGQIDLVTQEIANSKDSIENAPEPTIANPGLMQPH